MKNLLNNLLNWVLKKGSSETKKEQAWEEKEQAGSKKDQVRGNKLVQKRTKLEKAGSEAMSVNHALITQLSRNNHPISLRAIRYAAMIFMVLMVGIGQVWSADQVLKTVDFSTSAWSSATFTANATTVVDDVTASSSSSSSKPTISISSGKFTMSGNMSSGKNCVGFQVSGIQYGTLIIEVYSDASTITRCNYTVKDGGSSFSTSDAGGGTSSTAGEPIIVTGLTKTSAYVYVGRQGSSYTQFSKIIVKTPNPTGKTYAESTFYTTYASSSKTNAQLISSASFPENFLPIFDGASALNEKPASTPTVTTPYDFSGVSTSSKSYILQTANNNVLLLNNVANVKSVRFYGDGNGSSGNISVNVTKQSGSGSTFSVSNISFTSTYTILEHSTGDLTGKSGYDANTFYNYKFTFSKKFHIWGVYVEAIVAEKDYTVTAATSTGDNTYGTVSAAASSLDAAETTTITAAPATGYKVTNWAVSDGDNGASISPNGASNSNTTTLTMGTANATVTATFGPKSYTVTLNNQSATTAGTKSVTTTYNSNTNLTSTITKPTKTGYVFAGYFTGTNGTGIQLIDPAGNWIASAGGGSTYTDGSKNWKYDNNLTLYACWMNYANSLDLQTYVETVVGSSAGDKKTSTDYSILSSNNYFYLLNTASSSTCLDNSDNAAYRGLKFKRSGDYVLFLVPANYSLSVKFGYVKTTKPKYSINGGAESSFSTISLASDNQSVDMGSETYDRLVKIKAADDDAAVLKTVTITASCTAPNHVDITGDWHIWNEGSMTLTAKAYASEGTLEEITEDLTYQWYLNGTEEGNKIAGATSATYSKDNCTYSDAGAYYCKISTGEGCTTTSSYYNVKMLQVFVKDGSSDYGTIELTDIGSYEAQGTIRFASGSHTYKFGIRDGSLNWYGNSGTMISSNCTNWSMDKNTDCQITTTNYGTYTFTVKFGNMYDETTYGSYIKVSVNYPSDDQASDKVIYFDNTDRNWSNIYYRIGKTDHNQNTKMTAVPGTASLYKATTSTYNDLVAWHISNNVAWSGSNTIYRTYTDNDGYQISEAIEFDGAAITDAAITILPRSGHYKGGSSENSNCDFYYYDYKKFLVTHTATIGSTTNGSVRLNWTDINNAAQSATSTTSGLAHTCNLQITGVPDAGYDVATLTVNGSNFTSGNTHVLDANAVIAATFSPQVYTINYYDCGGGAFSGSHADGHPTSHTYNTATTLKGATLSNYTWDGWYTASDCASGKVTSLGATAYTASPNLYAKFTQAIALDREGASTGSTSVTATYKSATLPSITNPSKTGYTFGGWYTGDDGTGNLVINTSGALQESVSGYTGTGGIWTSSSARTLHAKWTAKQTTITINANTANHGSTTPGTVTATYGNALPLFTAASGVSGYSLTGYYTDATGGTKIINDDGTLVASTTYTTADSKWNSEAATLTLYAQYEEEGGGGDCVYSEVAKVTLTGDGDSAPTCTGSYSPSGAVKGLQDGNATGYYKLGGKPSYVKLQLGGGNTFQAGDSIILEIRAGDLDPALGTGSQTSTPVRLFTDEGETAFYTSSALTANTLHTVRIKVTADMISAGLSNTIYIYRTKDDASPRYSQNHQVKSIAVKHCIPSCTTPAAPTSPTNGATTSNSQAVSWTDASNDAWEVYVNTSSSTPDAGQSPTAEPTSTSYTFTGLTASTEYHWWVRSVCDASHKSAWVAGSSFTTSAAPTLYTVTFNSNGGSAVSPIEQASEGASITLPTPTKSGYTFQGWYTSGGTKAGDGGDSYNPGADITLYAQWRENCVGTATTLVDIDFKDAAWSDKTFSQGNTNDEDEINGVYFWAKDATKHFSLEDNTSNGLTFPNNNMSSGTYYFCIPITGINSSITVTLKHGYSSAQAEYKWAYVDGRTSFSDGNTGGSGGTKVQDASKASTEMTFTKGSLSNASGHLFIGRSSSSYTNIYGVTVTTPGAAGTCYYVTYNGNGATGGYTTDEAAYASGDNATAATNSFTKTGYTFGGWAISKANADAEIKAYDEGDAISITGNITLYAIWQAAGYTLAWNSNGGSALSGTYSSGSFADGATITAPNDPTRANYTFDSWNTARDGTGNAFTGTMPAANTTYYAVWKNTLTLMTGSQGSESDKSPTVFLDGSSLNGFSAHKAAGYTLQGYYTAATGGTKVLNADGSFAASNIARFVTSGKWSRTTGDTILVAQWESSYLLKWNLQLNKAEDAISTTSKESATARVTTASMTNLTNNGELTITSSKKSDLTSKIETPINLSGAESKYMSVSFDVTAGYQLLPSAVKVMVQPVGDGENKYAKLILEDENSHSISTVVTCEGTEKGKKTTVTLSNAGGTVFTGTVTLKILVYNASGASTTNNCYRLGSPIQIDGAIEAACNLPSYEGLEYDQTEYTVGVDEASAIRVTGGSADTYQWKWNSTNDRSTGTVVGTNDASYTPLITISEVGTRYYWCELTNDDCEGVVKTPAVAITVRANKSDASVTWTDPANEPNYGGGGYVIRATMNSGYDGELSAEDLTAPAGIRITNVSIDNEAAQKYIEATFDVTTAFDRDENSVIAFTLSHDATTGYDAISDEHKVDYDACSGGEEGSAAIALTSAIHDEGSGNAPRYWFETIGVGRVFGLNYGKATLGTSSDATFSTEGYSYVASSTSQRWVFQPYVEGVTKIRIYIKSATNTLRVLSIGKNASWQDQSSKYSNIAVDTIIYSNDKTTGLDNNQKGYAEIQFSSALTKDNYYMFTMSSSSTYIYGVTLYSGSVGDGGNLATSLTFANTGPIAADASTANFQNIASKSGENSNTLGTITYSSNNDAATVNATTGEVSIHAKETPQTVTITATLSASGCYQGATATYTINVAADLCDEPSGSIELTGSATKCSDESVTLTMTGFTSGAAVEWYNGDSPISNGGGYTITTTATQSTLTTKAAGTYSAIATSSCAAKRTNSITISNISATASVTKIVDKWYVKNGRLTPDIALWQLSEGATLDEVTIERNVSGEGTLGLTSSDFVARDGIVYLSGKEPSANETGADIEYTLTLTVKDACDAPHEMTEKTITLTHQKNTDKHVLAFVVNGTAKGGFTEGITAAQTTGVSLYNTIAAQFDVQTTNIYSTDDEQKLREYYSQYDILCITDYPNTQTKGVNSKSYVDAIGALIDIRPILTMEAFVSKLANWKAKGISGNPKSPTTRQYTMDLQCKDHEIFAGTKLTKVGEGEDEMYRVSMVDNTLEDYATLDATYGAILPHKEKESKSGAGDGEYNYGGKPALQGFTFTQEMIDNDLLPIGLIEDGAGNPLQVGIERQHNMEARLMVLGINSYAMERLTDDGERVVINALNYLMKKNQEDIADCSTSFVGGAEGDTKNWNNADNWTGNTVPLPTQKVRILAECEVSSTVYAQSVLIVTGGKYNHGSDDAAGKLTIKENGALIVGGKIQAASAPAYNRPRATTPDKLLIETSSTNQAALIFDNEEAETQATVKLYSLGRKPSSYQYQYFAVPMEVVPVNPTFANETHGGTGIYTYVYEEASSGWTRRKYYDDLFAFEGLGITTKSTGAMNYTMTGNLASTATKEITLTHDGAGLNLIGNSWMAPIQIGALAEDNTDANITQTAYIYCAGRDAEDGATSGVTETAGQWIAIPFEAAEFETWKATGKLSVIPAMQAFQIKVDAEATLTLDYDKVVRGSTNDLNAKLRAPGRRMVANEVTMTNIRVADSKTHTDLSLFEGDRFSEAFDNGWEAEYMNGDGRSAKLYAETEAGQMAVAAMYDYEGTVVGFAPGQETEYTFSFMGEDNGYYLNDIKLQNSVRISEGETYTFTYEEGDAANRFYISRTAINAPEVATGMENLDAAAPRVQKIIYNDKLYIIRGGRLYDATGKVVK